MERKGDKRIEKKLNSQESVKTFGEKSFGSDSNNKSLSELLKLSIETYENTIGVCKLDLMKRGIAS